MASTSVKNIFEGVRSSSCDDVKVELSSFKSNENNNPLLITALAAIESHSEWKKLSFNTMSDVMSAVRIGMTILESGNVLPSGSKGSVKHQVLKALMKHAEELHPGPVWEAITPILDDFISAQKTMMHTNLDAAHALAASSAITTCSAIIRCFCKDKNKKKEAKLFSQAFPVQK